MGVYMSVESDFSETVEVDIVKLGMVTASDMRMHHVLITLTLTFIQGHTDLNHKSTTCLIISETVQAMPIKFAVKIVRLKVYMAIASPMTLKFIQGHKCVSNLSTCNISDNIKAFPFKLGMTVGLCLDLNLNLTLKKYVSLVPLGFF